MKQDVINVINVIDVINNRFTDFVWNENKEKNKCVSMIKLELRGH